MLEHGLHNLECTHRDSGSAGGWRLELSVEALVLLVSVLLALIANLPFWRGALAGRSLGEFWTWRFSAATAVGLVMLHAIPLCLLATRQSVRALLAVLIVFSVLGSYFILSYGVLLDPSMLRNVLHTDIREASELVGAGAIGAFALALLAAASLWSVRLRRRTLKRALLIRAAVLGACVLLGALAMAIGFQDLSSVMRNNRGLRYTITPANIVWALGQIALSDTHALAAPHARSQPANRMMIASAAGKPTLLVIVLGETARAANFSLNGYTRTTNPQLARLDVINFGHTTACGTSTEVSLPCIFSAFGRAEYDARRIRNHESLLHLLARAAVRVVWLDNQSGCKGVCDGLEFRDLSREQIPGLCAEGHCYDEVLLRQLVPIVTDAGTDTVVVLHQIGNHGPAYFRRYPPEMKRFEPACERNELRECTREQIVNAYDNAIAYTDSLLANTIGFLESQRARFDVALLYVSDHGESLGEFGLYLHGMPYAIAPREQLHVPMLWWIPPEAARALDVDIECLRNKATQQASHDNIYHSVLGLLAVDTPSYKRERDLFDSCRAGSTRPNPQFAARDRPRIH